MIELLWALWAKITEYWFWVTRPNQVELTPLTPPTTPISPLSPARHLDEDLRNHLTKIIYYYKPDKTDKTS